MARRIVAEQQAFAACGGADGERKTITGLFAELEGSMGLIEGVDPEDACRSIDPALQYMMEAVHQYEGYVAQPMGDGIFVLFGLWRGALVRDDNQTEYEHAQQGQRFAQNLD